jgi:glycosyltransferase involved in cell wall biosynthesis
MPVSTTPPPRVSIGVPVYNGERFLRETLDSLLAQTESDFEILLCDNGSSDGTEAIGRDYAARDPRIRYERSEHNRGAAFNFNRTLELARAPYFKWAAADDVCAPSFIERCLAALEADPGIVLAYPLTAMIDEGGELIDQPGDVVRIGEWPTDVRRRTQTIIGAVFRDGRAAATTVHGVVRTEVLRRAHPFGAYFGSDFALVTELALAGRIVEVPELLAFFRRHPDSSSGYARRPSAKAMESFFHAGSGGWLRGQLALRRRYVEVPRAILRSREPLARRLALVGWTAQQVSHRASWRIGWELRALRRGAKAATDAAQSERPHWSQLCSADARSVSTAARWRALAHLAG